MAEWDEDSPQLRRNLERVLRRIAAASRARRSLPTVEDARDWQSDTMKGLDVPSPSYVGHFRGEPGPVEHVEVGIGAHRGTAASDVAAELRSFERTLQEVVKALDQQFPVNQALDQDGVRAVIDVCAWAHAEWVRIHPFVNGNGRTARLWANSLAMRYGLPPFVTLRPRPAGDYGRAGESAMRGNWTLTANVFHHLLRDFLAAH